MATATFYPESRAIVDNAASADRIRYVTSAEMIQAASRLVGLVPEEVSHVIGVSRSGLPAASIVAQMLHVPLSVLRQSHSDIVPAGAGFRLGSRGPRGLGLLIDDTVMTGNSMRRSRRVLNGLGVQCLAAVVYCNPENSHLVDFAVELLPHPHILEWNLFNSVFLPNCLCDMDGILCNDCPAPYDDDAEHYEAFLRDVKPLYLARKSPIHIVTARIEKYRQQTLDWLEKWSVQVASLTMGPWESYQERLSSDVGAWKAGKFIEFKKRDMSSVCDSMFVESDPLQAKRIFDVSGGVVVCPSARKVWA